MIKWTKMGQGCKHILIEIFYVFTGTAVTWLDKCGLDSQRFCSERSNSSGSSRQFVIVFSKHPLVTPPTKRVPDGKALTLF